VPTAKTPIVNTRTNFNVRTKHFSQQGVNATHSIDHMEGLCNGHVFLPIAFIHNKAANMAESRTDKPLAGSGHLFYAQRPPHDAASALEQLAYTGHGRGRPQVGVVGGVVCRLVRICEGKWG